MEFMCVLLCSYNLEDHIVPDEVTTQDAKTLSRKENKEREMKCQQNGKTSIEKRYDVELFITFLYGLE